MKWMLVVVVFNLGPVQTGLVYDSLKACLAAEASVRSQWAQIYNQFGPGPESAFVIKQSTPGTCIPIAPPNPK